MIRVTGEIICANLLLLEVDYPSSVSCSELWLFEEAQISLNWGSRLVEGDLLANQRDQCYELHLDLITKDETNGVLCHGIGIGISICIRIIKDKIDKTVVPSSGYEIGRT
jgi:hypothetical protein